MSSNLELWNKVHTPDPAFTKKYTGQGGFTGTSVNAVYTIKQLTNQFGTVGNGWGYNIIKEGFETGHTVYNDGEIVGNEIVHTIELEFWYMAGDKKCSFHQFGHTPYISYSNKYKTFATDKEYAKKSLTDAISKAASFLGFNADIFMGMFDDLDYLNQVADDFGEKDADSQVIKEVEARQEYEKLYKDNLALIQTATNMNELEKVFVSITRKSKKRNDAKGLRELTAAKDKRKAELEEKSK